MAHSTRPQPSGRHLHKRLGDPFVVDRVEKPKMTRGVVVMFEVTAVDLGGDTSHRPPVPQSHEKRSVAEGKEGAVAGADALAFRKLQRRDPIRISREYDPWNL